ncbi:PREDICTED: fatty acyl-CoA reductase 1-like [Priapulus caudatus]|uniref:Fatty acyl-CoA reductase n=1 Tax=Priapulus caudatus TaxID=37621 RepID=A0ABM1FAS9_PRICU|nr:PREDICTED: fatty acyl-CoA reductase 1-like [Priapulus caudatus]
MAVLNSSSKMRPSIAQFYAGKNVFITGGSGFIGKCVIEKLLRTCPNVGGLYLLMRPKRDKTPEERLQKVLESDLFNAVKNETPDSIEKLHIIIGDVIEPQLGMSDSDYELLTDKINVILHVAASINFTEPLRNAVTTNVIAVKDMLVLCRKCKHLQAIVHTSTAFVRPNLEVIEEKFYEFKGDYNDVIATVMDGDDAAAERITPELLGDAPNTYVYTKHMAECVLADEASDLPIAIVRPTLVTSTWKDDPISGWIESMAHLSGVLILTAKGYLRVKLVDVTKEIDMVPVDVVSNCIIAAGWRLGTSEPTLTIPIYNSSSTGCHRMTWTEFKGISLYHMQTQPFKDLVRLPYVYMVLSFSLFQVMSRLFHDAPAIILDQVSRLRGKKSSC